MKNARHLTVWILLSCCLWQCGSTTYTAENFPSEGYLMFGNGGGYAGTLTTHYLLPNGQLFKSERIAGAKLADGKVAARDARRLLERYREEMQSHDFQQPGNRYFFIEYVSADTTHAIQWGAPDTDPPAAVLDFYEALQSLLPKAEEAPQK